VFLTEGWKPIFRIAVVLCKAAEEFIMADNMDESTHELLKCLQEGGRTMYGIGRGDKLMEDSLKVLFSCTPSHTVRSVLFMHRPYTSVYRGQRVNSCV